MFCIGPLTACEDRIPSHARHGDCREAVLRILPNDWWLRTWLSLPVPVSPFSFLWFVPFFVTATNFVEEEEDACNQFWFLTLQFQLCHSRSNRTVSSDVVLLEETWGCTGSSVLLHVWWLQACELLLVNQIEVSSILVVVHHWFREYQFRILKAHSMSRHMTCQQTH